MIRCINLDAASISRVTSSRLSTTGSPLNSLYTTAGRNVVEATIAKAEAEGSMTNQSLQRRTVQATGKIPQFFQGDVSGCHLLLFCLVIVL